MIWLLLVSALVQAPVRRPRMDVAHFTAAAGVLGDYQATRIFWNESPTQTLLHHQADRSRFTVTQAGTYYFNAAVEFDAVGDPKSLNTGTRYLTLYLMRDRLLQGVVYVRVMGEGHRPTHVRLPHNPEGWELDVGDEIYLTVYVAHSGEPVVYCPMFLTIARAR